MANALTLASLRDHQSDTPSRYPLCSQTVQPNPPNALAFLVIAAYLSVAIAVGYIVRKNSDTAAKYLHARGALPAAVTALAFLAANCGALEVVGIVATSAKYGALALHFYWLGAIPAMLFLSLFMMPVYTRSGAMTVPDFIRLRYNRSHPHSQRPHSFGHDDSHRGNQSLRHLLSAAPVLRLELFSHRTRRRLRRALLCA